MFSLWSRRPALFFLLAFILLCFLSLVVKKVFSWPSWAGVLIFFTGLLCLYVLWRVWEGSSFLLLEQSQQPSQQEALRNSFDQRPGEEKFYHAHLMLDHHPQPLLLLNRDHRLILANKAAEDILEGVVQGILISSVFRNPDILDLIEKAFKGEKQEGLDFIMVTMPERVMKVYAIPVSEQSSQEVRHVMILLRDETATRNTERMRVDFLANASHELRTPLASLSGFIETLQGHARRDEAAQARFLHLMQGQTERMSRLVDDLLSLSRIELNEHIAPRTRVDLAALLHEAAAALTPLAEQRKQVIELDCDGDEVFVIADHDQMHEVFQNLLGNALKYSDGDGGLIRVSLHSNRTFSELFPEKPLNGESSKFTLLAPPVSPKPCCIFRVWDEGRGIERRHLSRLSERFYRVEGQKSGAQEGTGLGLAIVKHIIRRHHGGFSVESAPETGSVFSVLLPQAM